MLTFGAGIEPGFLGMEMPAVRITESMRPFHKQILKFFIFLGISVLLFWLVYRDQNWADLSKALKEDVNYTWIFVAIVMGLLSHVSRALRWQLLTCSMGYKIRFMNGFMGVMIGYFVNILVPRMGEFTRCGVVSRYENVPFSKLLGTVVTERVIDMLILLVLTLTVIVAQFQQIHIFLERNQDIEKKVVHMLNSWWMWGILLLLFAGMVWGWKRSKGSRFYERVKGFVNGLKEGILTIRNVEHKWLFIAHSLFIWLMYFLMMYVCFFCFKETSQLSVIAGLTVFVIGSYGMVAPVQGGIGAWHFMVISALLLYLPDAAGMESVAKTFALLTHGTMTLLYIVVGAACLVVLPLYNAKRSGYGRKSDL